MSKNTEAALGHASMSKSTPFERAIEQLTGESIDVIRRRTVWEQREALQKKANKPLQIISKFPFIGRGNVLRDKLVSGEEVNRRIDRALRAI